MTNKMVDFQKSQAMPDRPGLETVIALALALLPIIAVAVLIVSGYGRGDESTNAAIDSSALSDGPNLAKGPASIFDSDEAANLTALRWKAIAKYYADHGLLTRPTVDQFNIAPSWDVVQAERLEAERQMALQRRYSTAPGWEQALTDEQAAERSAQLLRYTTPPGWEQALMDEQAAAAQPAEDYAYYTERYWKHAAETGSIAEEADRLDLRHHRR